MTWLRPFRREEDREDVTSFDGAVTLNLLQQHPEGFDVEAPITPVEELGTTDPDGITDG